VIRINRESPEVIAARVEGLLEQRELHLTGDRILNRVARLDADLRRSIEPAAPRPAKKRRRRRKSRQHRG
jgi:hypothetical protein